jgi:uncharacterized repeat protein (TIGR04076 family)
MKTAVATVTRVTGTCNAGYEAGDKIVVNRDTVCIDKEASSSLCIFALRAILSSMCRLEPGKVAFASCPDPATGLGGNVRFEIVGGEDGEWAKSAGGAEPDRLHVPGRAPGGGCARHRGNEGPRRQGADLLRWPVGVHVPGDADPARSGDESPLLPRLRVG